MTDTIGSIIIRNDPVLEPEPFMLNLCPMDTLGHAEARFHAYTPLDRAEGGYWAASFTVLAREITLKELYENGLGRMIEVWGYGLEPDFEARIEEIIFSLPPDKFTIGLRTMGNRAHMRADLDDDGEVDRSTIIEHEESQDLYGIAEGVMSGGQLSGESVADQTIQSLINLRALPKPAAEFGTAGGVLAIEVFARGFITTLEQRVYNQTADVGNQSLSSQIVDVIEDVGQFIESIETEANTTSVTQEYDMDRTASSIVTDLPRLGDSKANRWLLDVYGRDCTGVRGRRAKLHQAAPVIPPE